MNVLTQFDPFFIFKIGIEILLFLYTIFAFVVVTQIKTMNRIIQQPPIGGILEIIGWAHVVLAASLFLLGLAIL
jgi:uncharacterized membrane protein YgdD (TMEM256/DUF423 family)